METTRTLFLWIRTAQHTDQQPPKETCPLPPRGSEAVPYSFCTFLHCSKTCSGAMVSYLEVKHLRGTRKKVLIIVDFLPKIKVFYLPSKSIKK